MKKTIALLCSLAMVAGLVGCSGGSSTATTTAAPAATEAATEAAAKEEAAPAETTAAAAEATGDLYGDVPDGWKLAKGDWVIGLSNAYYGNNWRKQSIAAVEEVAEQAKKDGLIKDLIVENGDGTANTQISQINSLVLQGIDLLMVSADSPTGVNSAIQSALDAGIPVVTYDSVADLDGIYVQDWPWADFSDVKVDHMLNYLGEEGGNVLLVRGVTGATPDALIVEELYKRLEDHPEINIVAEVYGEASSSTTQEAVMAVLPSLDKVDYVFTHCGNDSMGVVNAFEALDREVPMVQGDNTVEFIEWWDKQIQERGSYDTISMNSDPTLSTAAFWTALEVLNGADVPEMTYMSLKSSTSDDLETLKAANMDPGMIVSFNYSLEDTVNDILIPQQSK